MEPVPVQGVPRGRRCAAATVRARGGVAVVVAHRPSALAACNLILMMNDGRVTAFGPKDEVLGKILRYPIPTSAHAQAPTLKIVQELGAAK